MKEINDLDADALWQHFMRFAGFLADRGIQRQNREAKKLISELTVRQQQILREVYVMTRLHPDGVPLKFLAERLELSPGTASESVETLVRKHALKREICATDRRSVRIGVSPEGMAMIQLGMEQYRQDAGKLLSALSAKETKELMDMLEKMYRQLPESCREDTGTVIV